MLLPLLLAALLAPAGWLSSDAALSFTGERLPNGTCTATVVPDPDQAGLYTLKLTFRLAEHQANQWLDAAWRPAAPIALPEKLPLLIRVEQPTDWLHLKITDPDNPGGNRAAWEKPLTWQGRALPAGQWVEGEIPLPADPKLRDTVDSVSFYVPMGNQSVPLNQDLVFYVGRFAYSPPPRPAWPPRAAGGLNLQPIDLPPLQAGGPWVAVTGADNPSGRRAELSGREAVFDAPSEGWNEFLHTDPAILVLEPSTTYRLQYDYEVLREPSGGPANEATFYQLVRATGTIQEDVGWQRWTGPAGSTGRRVVTFTTHDKPGYYLIWGVRHAGALRLRDIKLWRLPNTEVQR